MKQNTVAAYNKSVDVASMPDRVRRLPISEQGWPVPWFVEWFKDGKPCATGDGVPDFRIVDPRKITTAVKKQKCWVCGEGPLGIFKCFVIGPMCSVNRIISEPPSHRDCAIFAARICPFLARPAMVRNRRMYDADGKFLFQEAGGVPLLRNPGAVCVWVTKPGSSTRSAAIPVCWARPARPSGQKRSGLPTADARRARKCSTPSSSGYPTLGKIARDEGSGSGRRAEDASASTRWRWCQHDVV